MTTPTIEKLKLNSWSVPQANAEVALRGSRKHNQYFWYVEDRRNTSSLECIGFYKTPEITLFVYTKCNRAANNKPNELGVIFHLSMRSKKELVYFCAVATVSFWNVIAFAKGNHHMNTINFHSQQYKLQLPTSLPSLCQHQLISIILMWCAHFLAWRRTIKQATQASHCSSNCNNRHGIVSTQRVCKWCLTTVSSLP